MMAGTPPSDEDVKVLKIMKIPSGAALKPLMNRAGYRMRGCDHSRGTFMISSSEHQIRCSDCDEILESFRAMEMLLDREWAKGRRENASAWQRMHAEEEAEKQAAKTRKAAYATLYRFGVTPEMYAEEYRKKLQLGELEIKQDYSHTIQFPNQAV